MQGRVPRGHAARPRRPTCASPACRSARSSRRTSTPAHPNRTVATIAARPDVRAAVTGRPAILRQKTLLGETYVELTPGNAKAAEDPRERLAGRLAACTKTVELDEIFQALDPVTRSAFQNWQQDLAQGHRPAHRAAATSTTRSATCPASSQRRDRRARRCSTRRAAAVRRLVRNTGVVFGALTQNEAQLHNLITNSSDVFERHAEARRRRWPRRSRSSRRSSTSPRRRSPSSRRSRGTPTR